MSIFAKAIIKVAERLEARGCLVTLRRTPAHKGVFEGNEVEDEYAKVVAENVGNATDRRHLRRASLAYMIRRTAEAGTQGTRDWIAGRVRSSRR